MVSLLTEHAGVVFASLALIAAAVVFVLVRRRFRRRKAPRSRYVEALNALLEGESDRALDELRQTVQADPRNTDAYLRLGDLLRRRGAVERALRIHRDLDIGTFFRKTLTVEEKRRVREAIADDLLAARRTEEALEVLAGLLGREKENHKIRAKMVALHERRSEWDEAYALYKEGFRLRKEKAVEKLARYRAFCGTALLESGNTARAKEAYLEALKLDPRSAEALYRLGAIRFDADEPDEAILYWERFHDAAPEHAYLTFERFERALYETGNLNRVEEVYRAILEKAPREERTLLALATFHARRGEEEKATLLARRAVEANPSSVAARDRLALLFAETLPPEKAVEELRGFLKEHPPPVAPASCSQCGHEAGGPFWRCPQCMMWNTMVARSRPSSSGSS